ncbi:MAG: tetratricopeptide repeat protein [Verrucomicrobiales bacterium]|nr:tetratricopeptide repeat protein [Verrucomicrobiales bacterium]
MRFLIGLVKRPTAMALALAVGILVGATQPAQAQQDQAYYLDPSDIWYRAYLLIQAAEESEKQGNYLDALAKLNEAKPLFDHLAQAFPEFQPEMVRGRRGLIAEKRDELKQLERSRTTAPPVAPAPMAPPTAPSTGRWPQTPSPARPPGNPGIPSVEIAPPAFPPGSRATERSFDIESNSGEFALPQWDQGSGNQQLPRVGSATNGMPQVQTPGVRPSAGEVASSIYDQLAEKDRLIDWLNNENLKQRRLIAERENEIKNMNAELARAQASRSELQRQIDAAENGPGGLEAQQKIDQLKGLLREATKQLEASTDRNAKLVAELTRSQGEINKLKERVASLERERDNLAEVVQGQGNSGTALKELMERNRKLTEQLDRAEQLAASLSELNKEKDKDIAMLKSEISKIRLERDKLLADNQRHQQSIDDLQRKLEMLSDGLTTEEKNALASASPMEREENELLRSMVLKQLRRQAQMKQAKELLIRQLDKVGARSDTLLGLIDDMARGSQLTDEEKELFKAPQFQEIVEAAADEGEFTVTSEGPGEPVGSMSGTFVASGGGNGTVDVVKNQKIAIELSQIEKAARLDFSEGRLSEAEAGFLKYLHYRPKSVPCLCNLGVLKISMKNYSEAEYYLEKALAIDDSSGLAHYLLGRAYFLQNKLDDALAALEQGLTHDPKNAKAHNCVGVISTRKGWVSRAERAFTNAVSIDPEYGDAHFNLAVLHATKEQPDPKAAEEHYFKALHLGVPRDSAIEGFLKEFEASGGRLGMR